MRKLVYNKDNRQYYWLDDLEANKCSNFIINKQEYDKLITNLKPIDITYSPLELIVCMVVTILTFSIIFTAY